TTLREGLKYCGTSRQREYRGRARVASVTVCAHPWLSVGSLVCLGRYPSPSVLSPPAHAGRLRSSACGAERPARHLARRLVGCLRLGGMPNRPRLYGNALLCRAHPHRINHPSWERVAHVLQWIGPLRVPGHLQRRAALAKEPGESDPHS